MQKKKKKIFMWKCIIVCGGQSTLLLEQNYNSSIIPTQQVFKVERSSDIDIMLRLQKSEHCAQIPHLYSNKTGANIVSCGEPVALTEHLHMRHLVFGS